jgi:putative tryptophan/tyrosine transport system substrate-binding protein
MRRREFILITLVGGATIWPPPARALQLVGKNHRIGFLGTSRISPVTGLPDPITGLGFPAFLDELQRSGFSEGQNLVIEVVRMDQEPQRLFAETAALVQSNVELLITEGTEIALQAALAASPNIPIVFWANNFDPIARGYIKSLTQPGTNMTGVVSLQTELAAKQVELLTQAFPERTRLAVLYDAISADEFGAAQHQASLQHLDVRSLKLENPPYDFDSAFRSLAEGSPQILLVLSSPFFTPQRTYIAQLAIRQKLPTMFIFKTYVEAGGLMSYGTDPKSIFRQLGFYVAKILNGSKPADLPVQQAVKFELVINLKTANMIGVDLSTAIQLRADDVIE